MRIIFKQFLKYYLKALAKLALFVHRPLVIGVTGSLNGIFTKKEIERRLAEAGFSAKASPKNFNTEIGLPLAILSLAGGKNYYKDWLITIWQGFKSIFNLKLEKILILDLGVAKPGDMEYLLSIIIPKIAVITDISQRYADSFSGMDELMKEYEHLARKMAGKDYLIINYDNQLAKKLCLTNNKSIIFGMEELKNNPVNYWRGELIKKTLTGQQVRINHNDKAEDFQINRFGRHHIYAMLAGLIVKEILENSKYAIKEK